MNLKSLLSLAILVSNSGIAYADQTEDLNAFALVLSIPIYAKHCAITLSETAIGNISTKASEMQASMGINDAQVADLQTQMNDQFGKADCTEGSDDRTNFDNTIKAYEAQQ